MQASDVILTQVSKCMAPSTIVDPGETIEAPFSPSLFNVNHEHEETQWVCNTSKLTF